MSPKKKRVVFNGLDIFKYANRTETQWALRLASLVVPDKNTVLSNSYLDQSILLREADQSEDAKYPDTPNLSFGSDSSHLPLQKHLACNGSRQPFKHTSTHQQIVSLFFIHPSKHWPWTPGRKHEVAAAAESKRESRFSHMLLQMTC